MNVADYFSDRRRQSWSDDRKDNYEIRLAVLARRKAGPWCSERISVATRTARLPAS